MVPSGRTGTGPVEGAPPSDDERGGAQLEPEPDAAPESEAEEAEETEPSSLYRIKQTRRSSRWM